VEIIQSQLAQFIQDVNGGLCPDCGTEMTAGLGAELYEPFRSQIYFYCQGRCHVEFCEAQGIDPQTVKGGIPKSKTLISVGEGNREVIDHLASEIVAAIRKGA
jgi:hypothetical protein